MTQTLKPYIDSNFRTLSDRDNTAIGGSSRGGFISTYVGLKHQDVYSKVLAFSPTYHPEILNGSIVDYAASVGKHHEMTFYMDYGDAELVLGKPASEYIDYMNQMVSTLRDAGFTEDQLINEVIPGGVHSEQDWSERFPDVIQRIFN